MRNTDKSSYSHFFETRQKLCLLYWYRISKHDTAEAKKKRAVTHIHTHTLIHMKTRTHRTLEHLQEAPIKWPPQCLQSAVYPYANTFLYLFGLRPVAFVVSLPSSIVGSSPSWTELTLVCATEILYFSLLSGLRPREIQTYKKTK